jgi:hypothetical protein
MGRIQKEKTMEHIRELLPHLLERLKKITRNPSKNGWFTSQDSNRAPPESKPRYITVEITCLKPTITKG